jgi:cold shock CspA family protein
MKRNELTNGTVLELRGGKHVMVHIQAETIHGFSDLVAGNEVWFPLSSLPEDLYERGCGFDSQHDVMKVKRPKHNESFAPCNWVHCHVIWEYKEQKMIEIKGKKYSEESIIEALKAHCPE